MATANMAGARGGARRHGCTATKKATVRAGTAASFGSGRPTRSGRPPTGADQATVFIFSAVTAMRLDSGCATSLASLMSISVERDVSATIWSKNERA